MSHSNVLGAKQQKGGKHIGGYHLTCEKMPDPPDLVKNNGWTPTANEQGVLTDILIELTKNNKFGLKSPAIARHLIILNNIFSYFIVLWKISQNYSFRTA